MAIKDIFNKVERTKITFKSGDKNNNVAQAAFQAIINSGGSTGDEITIDAILSRDHSRQSRVTRFKVEDGADISDHIIKEPKKLKMQCFVSADGSKSLLDAAVSVAKDLNAASSTLIEGATDLGNNFMKDPVGSVLNFGTDVLGVVSPDGSRPSQVFSRIEKAWLNSEELIIETPRAKYESMVITDFSTTDSAEYGDSLSFSLDLQEIRKVTSSISIVSGVIGAIGDFINSSVGQNLVDQFNPFGNLGEITKAVPIPVVDTKATDLINSGLRNLS